MIASLFLSAAAATTLAAPVPLDPAAAYRDVPGLQADAAAAVELPAAEWWRLFGDPALDDLAAHALQANPELAVAAARVEQARAAAGLARSAYWPQLALGAELARERTSRTTENVQPDTTTTTYRAPLVASWELDLFGRVRRASEAARADAEAAAANWIAVRLALTSDVAVNYFSLRAAERELALIRESAALRRRAVELVSARQRSGLASELDTVRAEAELATVEAEAAAVANRRAALQNALAVLAGEAAPSFRLAQDVAAPAAAAAPVVPPGVPSELLARRPDIAAAEHALVAAHARIGVARAAFFPAISLTGAGGYASGDLSSLFDGGSKFWSLGPSVYVPIFQGGRNRANLARARAAEEEAVARYRQTVLVALREVQDALTAQRLLADQAAAQDRALTGARRAATLAETRYAGGLVSYFEVIDARRTSLATERAAVQLAAQRQQASVALIKALGGGWHRATVVAAAGGE